MTKSINSQPRDIFGDVEASSRYCLDLIAGFESPRADERRNRSLQRAGVRASIRKRRASGTCRNATS